MAATNGIRCDVQQIAALPTEAGIKPCPRSPLTVPAAPARIQPVRFLKLFTAPFAMLHAKLNPVAYARKIGVRMGKGVQIFGSSYAMFSAEPWLVTLGDNVTVSFATFLCHDGATIPFRKDYPDLDVTAPIVVGNDCFIGYHAIILPGVTIGDGCIVGAGAVVAKDIEPGMVVVGNPARVIMTREAYLEKARARSTGLGNIYGPAKHAAYRKYFGLN